MNLKPAEIELPLQTGECVRVGCDCTESTPNHPFPKVVGLCLGGASHTYFYELPDTMAATWDNRRMLCLLFNLDGLLFYWKSYQKHGRVIGLNTKYHLHFYWAQNNFSASEEWVAKHGHTSYTTEHHYLTYCPNEGIPKSNI